MHFYARYYDPKTGTWLTQDTYRGELQVPGTGHRYGYVLGNPTTFVDQYGYVVEIEKDALKIKEDKYLIHDGGCIDSDSIKGLKWCGNMKVVGGEAGAAIKPDLVGLEAEGNALDLLGDAVIGDERLGLTIGINGKGAGGETLVGYNGRCLGAMGGIYAGKIDLHIGVNLFDTTNIGLAVEGIAGQEYGGKIGGETKVALGNFAGKIVFDKPKNEAYYDPNHESNKPPKPPGVPGVTSETKGNTISVSTDENKVKDGIESGEIKLGTHSNGNGSSTTIQQNGNYPVITTIPDF